MSSNPSLPPLPLGPSPKRATRQAKVVWKTNIITVGGDAPVRVQSMTNTDTADAVGTAIQVKELARAGSEMVRITVNTPEAAAAVPYIREQLDKMDILVPLIGDFHYNGHTLLNDFPDCAKALSKYRINPGNVGKGAKRDPQFAQMIEAACKYDKPIRIGVNWGSLDQDLLASIMDSNAALEVPKTVQEVMIEALIQSALQSAEKAVELGMNPNQILLSCKVSNVQDLVAVYRDLSRRSDYPLHLGVTEAGPIFQGTIKSATAFGILLSEGIGDTIRVSMSAPPVEEVKVGISILESLGLRQRKLEIVSCPSCGRAQVDVYTLAESVQAGLQGMTVPLRVAVMGCVVNGPGEAREADLGVASGNGKGQIFVKGEVIKTVPESQIVETLIEEAMRLAEEMEANGVESGAPTVVTK